MIDLIQNEICYDPEHNEIIFKGEVLTQFYELLEYFSMEKLRKILSEFNKKVKNVILDN